MYPSIAEDAKAKTKRSHHISGVAQTQLPGLVVNHWLHKNPDAHCNTVQNVRWSKPMVTVQRMTHEQPFNPSRPAPQWRTKAHGATQAFDQHLEGPGEERQNQKRCADRCQAADKKEAKGGNTYRMLMVGNCVP